MSKVKRVTRKDKAGAMGRTRRELRASKRHGAGEFDGQAIIADLYRIAMIDPMREVTR